MKKLLWVLAIVSMLCMPLALAQDMNTTTGTDSAPANETTTTPTETAPTESTTPTDTASAETMTNETVAPETETAPAATETETAPAGNETGGNLEAELETEPTTEEQNATETELAKEATTVSPNLPGGFSRFLSGVGDAFTFNKHAKAKRALDRARENKLRILAKMNAKGTGLARSPHWAADMAQLQQYVNEDMQKANDAVDAADGSTDSDLEAASEVNEDLNEQGALDQLVSEKAQETAQASPDLSSEDVAALNNVGKNLAQTTAATKGKAKKHVLDTAGKLLAKGKSVKDVKAVKDKTVKHKEMRAKTTKMVTHEMTGKGKSETKRVVKTETVQKTTKTQASSHGSTKQSSSSSSTKVTGQATASKGKGKK